MTPALPWWSGTVIYQLIVRSYSDGNGDGTGDFKGLAARLPYLRWLGVNTLWLTPIYPSPCGTGATTSPISPESIQTWGISPPSIGSSRRPTARACA